MQYPLNLTTIVLNDLIQDDKLVAKYPFFAAARRDFMSKSPSSCNSCRKTADQATRRLVLARVAIAINGLSDAQVRELKKDLGNPPTIVLYVPDGARQQVIER